MRKNHMKKITLNRETVYGLTPPDVTQARGGVTQIGQNSCGPSPDCSAVCTVTHCSECCG